VPALSRNASGAKTPMADPATKRKHGLSLLDFGFAKFDVLFGDRVVFLLDQFIGHGARVLARHVIKSGVRAGHQLDLYRGVLGHLTLDKTRDIAALAAT
jgi:hypothetical protein